MIITRTTNAEMKEVENWCGVCKAVRQTINKHQQETISFSTEETGTRCFDTYFPELLRGAYKAIGIKVCVTPF